MKVMMHKNYKFTLEDLRHYDSQIYQSLKMIKNSDLTKELADSLMLTFQLELYDEKGLLI